MNPSPDPFELVGASVSDIAVALRRVIESDRQENSDAARWNRVAIEVLASAIVELVRRGTASEIDSAMIELAECNDRMGAERPTASFDLLWKALEGFVRILNAAAEPGNPSSAAMVLRGWGGAAKKALQVLDRADGHSLSRADLRRALDEPSESYLSHLLSAMEDSRLAFRIRQPGSKHVDVVLGPQGFAALEEQRTWTDSSALSGVFAYTWKGLPPHESDLTSVPVSIQRLERYDAPLAGIESYSLRTATGDWIPKLGKPRRVLGFADPSEMLEFFTGQSEPEVVSPLEDLLEKPTDDLEAELEEIITGQP